MSEGTSGRFGALGYRRARGWLAGGDAGSLAGGLAVGLARLSRGCNWAWPSLSMTVVVLAADHSAGGELQTLVRGEDPTVEINPGWLPEQRSISAPARQQHHEQASDERNE